MSPFIYCNVIYIYSKLITKTIEISILIVSTLKA